MNAAQRAFFSGTRFGKLEVGPFEVWWSGKPVELTSLEREILLLLLKRDGQPMTFKGLAFGIGFNGWDETVYGNVRCYIGRVRRAFRRVDPSFQALEAVYGVGFRWRG